MNNETIQNKLSEISEQIKKTTQDTLAWADLILEYAAIMHNGTPEDVFHHLSVGMDKDLGHEAKNIDFLKGYSSGLKFLAELYRQEYGYNMHIVYYSALGRAVILKKIKTLLN